MTAGRDDADCWRPPEDRRGDQRRSEERFQIHLDQYKVAARTRAREIVVIKMYYVCRITGAIALLALAAAAWFSITFARADAEFGRHTPESVARAIQLMPRNTEYLAFHALQLDYEGEDSTPVLERIAVLNPLSSAPRIRLGLAAETRGDFATAERWLLDAARVDHQFEPRWTLANYYFRRENAGQFWKGIRLALELSYGDRRPAFDLCWRISSDAAEILDRAIPDRHDVVSAYLSYVAVEHHIPAVLPGARKLASFHDPKDLPLLYAACDALLESGDEAAVEIWTLTGRPVPYGVVNGDFAGPPLNHGFDWRLLDPGGVTFVNLPAPPALRISMSGKQPESCDLLVQIMRLKAGARYVLQWEARTQALPAISGLEWRLENERAAIVSSDDWRAGEANFVAHSHLPRLVLAYQRPSGEPRADGFLELRHVSIRESDR